METLIDTKWYGISSILAILAYLCVPGISGMLIYLITHINY